VREASAIIGYGMQLQLRGVDSAAAAGQLGTMFFHSSIYGSASTNVCFRMTAMWFVTTVMGA
jgi:hypothetical protein